MKRILFFEIINSFFYYVLEYAFLDIDSLRILGTLSRLHLRDKKSFRLPDLIKTLEFFIETTSKYKRFKAISSHLGNKILPILKLKIKEIL